jgi:hypothetical protein
MVVIERDMFRFRRRVPGHVPGQGRCHSLIELSTDSRFVLLHLASVSWFSVALSRQATLRLLHLLDEPEPDRIPARRDGGECWVIVRPSDRAALPAVHRRDGPAVELSLSSRDREIRIVFLDAELHDLRRDLTAAYLQLESP